MNLDEALGKITDPEVKEFFSKIVKDQNGYISKLEAQLKELSKAGPAATGTDDVTMRYLEKNMRKDVIAEAKAKILDSIPKEIFDVVEKDWLAFLEKGMDKAHTTEEFAVDAFNLVYGRCFADKNHPLHRLGKGPSNPGATPTPPQAGTNGAAIAGVQNILSPQPPVMTGKDTPAASGLPETATAPKNTKDAFTRFRERIAQSGGSKFQ